MERTSRDTPGAERTREEWEMLIKAADENLRIVDVREMDGSVYSAMEVVADDV